MTKTPDPRQDAQREHADSAREATSHGSAAARMPSQPLRSAQLSARKPTHFTFHPDAAARRAIADALDLIDLPALRFEGALRPSGRADFTLEAMLYAKAVQPCSVSLAPVPVSISETVRRHYEADFIESDAEEVEMIDEETEALPEVLDIAAIAAEALALALPQYPRAPDADLGTAVFAAPGIAPLVEADLKPFSGLAGLARQMKTPDSGSSSDD